ncbi:MAG: hypothetical protein KGJ62_06390 [Armatimonadetes bacterium]|nr:hypothetical protein [Armatimonadota bacterium]MDE2206543.1 hypothetical protein [Armatimonadota bacterium]
MKSQSALAFAVVLLAAAALSRSAFAQALPEYSIININPVGLVGTPAGINDDCQVVGTDSSGKGFVWMPGVPSYHFDTDGATQWSADAINNLGTIGGAELNATTYEPALWAPSAYLSTAYSLAVRYFLTTTGTPGAFFAINDDGWAAGRISDSSDADGHATIEVPPGSVVTGPYGTATGVSPVYEDLAIQDDTTGEVAAFSLNMFTTPAIRDLPVGGTFNGNAYSAPSRSSGIDAADDIVGYQNNLTTTQPEAYAWNGLQLAAYGPLGLLPHAPDSEANAVNDVAGYVVGSSGERAFIWRGDLTNPTAGTMTDLNTLVQPRSGWLLRRATALDDYGDIVGTGYYHQAPAGFLAIPTVLNGMTLSVATVIEGSPFTGTITLSAPAPFDMSVTLTTYNAKVNFGAGIYSTSVIINAGDTSAGFAAGTTTVTAPTPVTLKATFGGWRQYAHIVVIP